MEKPLVSVIVPVYNAECWLSRCLTSALGQTVSNIELICVDDASTDQSNQLLAEAARRDSRIHPLFFSEHQGVSKARNAALDLAKGEFVFFLDADDWIAPDHLEAMLSIAKKYNLDALVSINYDKVYADGRVERGCHFGFKEASEKLYPSSYVQSHILPVLWLRLYRLTFLNDNRVRFPLIDGGGEDSYFTTLAEALLDSIYVFMGPCYHYFQHSSSLAHLRDKAFPYIQKYSALYDELCDRNIPCNDLKLFYCGIIELDTREKFDFLKQYLTKVESVIRKHPEYYTEHDIMLIDLVLSSPNYDFFRQNHHSNITIEYIRSKMKKHE